MKLGKGWRNRQGKGFEAEVRESLKYVAEKQNVPIFWQRLYDYRDYLIVHKNIQVPHQPSDFYAVVWGRFYFLECKSTHINRVRYDTLKPHQKEAQIAVKKAGGNGYILLSSRTYPKAPNRCWALTIEQWQMLEDRCIKEDRKTFSLDEAAQIGKELQRSNGVWLLLPCFIHIRI